MDGDRHTDSTMEVIRPPDLAGAGQRSMERAKFGVPVLTAIRMRYGDEQPLAGARIAAFCPPTPHFAALVDVLSCLGASVRWAPGEGSEPNESAWATVPGWARDILPRLAWQSSWDYVHCALDWDDGGTASLILDKDGNAARLVHWGVVVEGSGASGPSNAEQAAADDAIRRRLLVRPAFYSTLATSIVGSGECTALGVERLRQIDKADGLMFPVIDASTGGLSGLAPDRDRVATDKLAALLARLVLVQVELFSTGATLRPGLHRFPDRLQQTLLDCEAAAARRGLAVHRSARGPTEATGEALPSDSGSKA
jgi:hypothetical protein